MKVMGYEISMTTNLLIRLDRLKEEFKKRRLSVCADQSDDWNIVINSPGVIRRIEEDVCNKIVFGVSYLSRSDFNLIESLEAYCRGDGE